MCSVACWTRIRSQPTSHTYVVDLPHPSLSHHPTNEPPTQADPRPKRTVTQYVCKAAPKADEGEDEDVRLAEDMYRAFVQTVTRYVTDGTGRTGLHRIALQAPPGGTDALTDPIPQSKRIQRAGVGEEGPLPRGAGQVRGCPGAAPAPDGGPQVRPLRHADAQARAAVPRGKCGKARMNE
jgi:hypothetical protein